MPHFFTRICRQGCVIDMLEQPDSKATQAEIFFSDLTSVYYLFYTLWVCFFMPDSLKKGDVRLYDKYLFWDVWWHVICNATFFYHPITKKQRKIPLNSNAPDSQLKLCSANSFFLFFVFVRSLSSLLDPCWKGFRLSLLSDNQKVSFQTLPKSTHSYRVKQELWAITMGGSLYQGFCTTVGTL